VYEWGLMWVLKCSSAYLSEFELVSVYVYLLELLSGLLWK